MLLPKYLEDREQGDGGERDLPMRKTLDSDSIPHEEIYFVVFCLGTFW